jgi:tetratricopeptide (TPR) repeat protein
MGALGMRQVSVSAPTDDLAAYELFLRGRQQFHARGSGPLKSAIADLRAAVERDPEFAEAWSYLAASLSTIPGYERMDVAEFENYEREATLAAERALRLDPGQALAAAVQGQITGRVDRLKRMQLLERAVAMAPDDVTILMWAGNDLFTAGAYLDETLPLLERAYRLDPLSGINNGVLGMAYLAAGRRDLAYQHIRRANELGWPHGAIAMALDLFDQGEVDAAIAILRAFWPADESLWTDSARLAWEFLQRVMRGEATSADVAAFTTSEVLDEREMGWHRVYYQVLGDYERMFDSWLAFELDYVYLFRQVFYPGGRAVMEHPRMLELAEKHLVIPVWEAKGYPFGCERVQDERGDHFNCPDWPK